MQLGDLETLQQSLGGRVGMTYCCALKKAAGYGGRRWFDVEAVVNWLARNPAWRMTRVYRSGQKQCERAL